MSATAELVARMMRILEDASEGSVRLQPEDDGPGSLGRLELGSLTMMAFLVGIEDEFAFVWDDTADPSVFDSFTALARYLHRHVPAARDATEVPR